MSCEFSTNNDRVGLRMVMKYGDSEGGQTVKNYYGKKDLFAAIRFLTLHRFDNDVTTKERLV